MSSYPGLTFSLDEKHLVATIHPLEHPAELDVGMVRDALGEAGFADWPLTDDLLLTLVERYMSATGELVLPLAERRDASFSLEISPDAMQVWVNSIPARAGKALEADEIYIALSEAEVIFGVDEAAVIAACSVRSEERVLVASGRVPENGDDARFELLVPEARDRAPKVNEHGMIDFRELGAIPSVGADAPLMRRIPATTGTAGRTVRGAVVEPVPGRNEKFSERLLGAYVDKDDPNLLRAIFSGQPVQCATAVNVEQVLRVRNVNMASGNISFDGTVNVEGEVLPGMKVHASGDIIVWGVVEAAELKAGGDIRVAGGIIAKAQVWATGSVSARFVENAHVVSGTTIAIDDSVLQSELQANNQIIVGVKSPQRGRLTGGEARATMLIQTPFLGSASGGVTRLLLGVNPVLEAEYQALLHKLEKLREDESNLEKLVKHLSKSSDKAALLERAKSSWQQALQAWAKLLPEREALEHKMALIAGARIDVGVGVAGAIDLTFGKKVLRMRGAYDVGSLMVEGERIVFKDKDGNSVPAA